MKYRIKQISEDAFLPQARTYWFTSWKNIRHYYSSKDFALYEIGCYEEYCVRDTKEKAQETIDALKEHLKEQKKYPIYHKVK